MKRVQACERVATRPPPLGRPAAHRAHRPGVPNSSGTSAVCVAPSCGPAPGGPPGSGTRAPPSAARGSGPARQRRGHDRVGRDRNQEPLVGGVAGRARSLAGRSPRAIGGRRCPGSARAAARAATASEEERALVAVWPIRTSTPGRTPGSSSRRRGTRPGSRVGSAPPRVPRNSGGRAGLRGGPRSLGAASGGRVDAPPRRRRRAERHGPARGHLERLTTSPSGGDCRIARLNSPSAAGATSRSMAHSAPADWPASVTRAGSPPNASMFSRTHSSAAI